MSQQSNRNRRSLVWEHFLKVPGGAEDGQTTIVCQVCSKVFRYFGNTTNMHEHMKRKHPSQYAESLQTKANESAAADVDCERESDVEEGECIIEHVNVLEGAMIIAENANGEEEIVEDLSTFIKIGKRSAEESPEDKPMGKRTCVASTGSKFLASSGGRSSTRAEDEFDTFGRSVAAQLRKLPLSIALESQGYIYNYVLKKRLSQI